MAEYFFFKLIIRMIFSTRGVFGVGDYESELDSQKFTMANSIWWNKMQTSN